MTLPIKYKRLLDAQSLKIEQLEAENAKLHELLRDATDALDVYAFGGKFKGDLAREVLPKLYAVVRPE